MDVEFEDMTLMADSNIFNYCRKKKILLKSISGQFRAGEFAGILGPSGAGKTSLLNALAGYSSRRYTMKGILKMNGQPRDETNFKKISCYVGHEDQLTPFLTLDETMKFAASLNLPLNYTSVQKNIVVEKIQELLRLINCKDMNTEMLCGGEKRRLSVALELINNPSVIFLDEPTTGLDNVAALDLLKLLNCLAHQGRTIVCTIHQPSAKMFALFDNIYVMANGLCIYNGSTEGVVSFLYNSLDIICPTHYNPADYVIEIAENEEKVNVLSKAIGNGKIVRCHNRLEVNVENGNNLKGNKLLPNVTTSTSNDSRVITDVNLFKYGHMDDNIMKGSCLDFYKSWWSKYWILLSRMYLQCIRNKMNFYVLFFTYVGVGVLVGCLYFQVADDADSTTSVIKLCEFISVFHSLVYCIIVTLGFPFEVKLVKKEYFNQWYSQGPYFLALTSIYVPQVIFFSFIVSVIIYFMIGLPYDINRFLMFFLIGFLIAHISEALGHIIGVLVNSVNGAVVASAILSTFFSLSIYGLDFVKDIPFYMWPIIKSSFIRSGLMGLVMILFGMDRNKLECLTSDFCFGKDPKVVIHILGLENQTPWNEIWFLFMIFILLKLLFFIALKYRLNK